MRVRMCVHACVHLHMLVGWIVVLVLRESVHKLLSVKGWVCCAYLFELFRGEKGRSMQPHEQVSHHAHLCVCVCVVCLQSPQEIYDHAPTRLINGHTG